jgi:hypothetical protein
MRAAQALVLAVERRSECVKAEAEARDGGHSVADAAERGPLVPLGGREGAAACIVVAFGEDAEGVPGMLGGRAEVVQIEAPCEAGAVAGGARHAVDGIHAQYSRRHLAGILYVVDGL